VDGETRTLARLLRPDGLARCEAVMTYDLPRGWGDRVRDQIASGDMEKLLRAAKK
jgi:hypothetical protein